MFTAVWLLGESEKSVLKIDPEIQRGAAATMEDGRGEK
jgi:hypothetical protein